MASKSGQEQTSTEQIEELLDAVESTLDRLKTLYEQYFLGIQKQAPSFIHNDVERKLRDLTQINIRNTGLRYRLATLQQKFGSYNSYWRRTLRQIENGTYARNLAKIGREAARNGADIPEEILAAMPKRMREQVLRDRDAALAIAKRRNQVEDAQGGTLADAPAQIAEAPRHDVKTKSGAHVLDESDADIDFNALFSAFDDDAPKTIERAKKASTMPPTQRPAMPRMPTPSDPARPRPAGASAVPNPVAHQGTARMAGGVPGPDKPPMASGTAPTSAIPQPVGRQGTAPMAGAMPGAQTPTTGIPRPMGQQGSAPTGVPRPVGQQPSAPTPSGVPRPVGQQPSAPTSSGIARPVGQQPSAPAGTARPPPPGIPAPPAIPRPPAIPAPPRQQTGPVPAVTQPIPRPAPGDASRPTPTNVAPRPTPTNAQPRPQSGPVPTVTQGSPRPAPSQQSRPIPVMPGSASRTGPVPVESMSGPFPRSEKSGPTPTAKSGPQATPKQTAPQKPPPGMSEADVNALHAKYVKAKESIGEKVDAGSRDKLLKTINQTAPKIMEQYKASGVDFSVVVKDNQVVIKAKPKT